MLGIVAPVEDVAAYAHYRYTNTSYGRAPILERRPLPCFGGAGTGGFEGLRCVMLRQGYRSYVLVADVASGSLAAYAPYIDLMKEVKNGFGRTMSHLPAVFGVSRQTLYNWLSGEIPKEQHQGKLVQLAAAARVFVDMGFKPTGLALDRTVAQGKSFIELIGEGADGKEVAQRLVRIIKRGDVSREKFGAVLGSRTFTRLDVADMGRPFLNEAV